MNFLQSILKKMFVAVAREHVNVTKKHSVPFALVSRDLKVTACFIVLFHVSLCIQVCLWLKYTHQLNIFVSKR